MNERIDLYLCAVGICLLSVIVYACLRGEIFESIHSRGVRSKEIYRHMKGFTGFFWYLKPARVFGCRFASVLAIIWTCLFSAVTLYAAAFGWWTAIPKLAICIPVTALGAMSSIVVGYIVVSRNYRLFDSPFVVLAAIRIRNVRGNFLNTAYYSIFLDLIYMLLPVGATAALYFL